jgi:hypothetical protein
VGLGADDVRYVRTTVTMQVRGDAAHEAGD